MNTILAKVKKEDLNKKPFPFLIFEDAFNDDVCLELLKEYPEFATVTGSVDYKSNRRFSFPAHKALEDSAITPTWNQFIKLHVSQKFLDDAMRVFGDSILEVYPNFENDFGCIKQLKAGVRHTDSFEDCDVLIDAQICMNTPVFSPSSVRGGHLDSPNKLIFGIFYLRHPDDKSQGGRLQILKYKKKDYKYNQGKDIASDYTEIIDEVEYKRNMLFLALNTPDAVHGVSPRSSSNVPRYFVNLVFEVKKPLFVVPKENRIEAFLKRSGLLASFAIKERHPSPYSLNFFDKEKETIVVLNPHDVDQTFPDIVSEYNLIYREDFDKLSLRERQNAVALLVGKGKDQVTKEIFNTFPKLKVAGLATGSLKKFNAELFIERNIPIINIGDVYADAVAEFALMSMLVGIRNASLSHDLIREKSWKLSSDNTYTRLTKIILRVIKKIFGDTFITKLFRGVLEGIEMVWIRSVGDTWERKIQHNLLGSYNKNKDEFNASKKTLQAAIVGIVGFGPVSRRLIELLKPFNCEIRVFSEYLDEETAKKFGVSSVTIDEVCKADVVTIHRGLSERTKGSFGKREIDLLPTGSVLVNTSRGAIVDEEALISRLEKGDLFACLDVYKKEPLPRRHRLRELPNVFLTSHIANSTDSIYRRAIKQLGKDLLTFLDGDVSVKTITSLSQIENMS